MELKLIHIIAGLLSLVAGAVALSAAKGSTLHRRSGTVFAIAMLTMTSSAVIIAAFLRPNQINVVAGTLTFYLVCTGLLTVKRSVEQSRALVAAFMLIAFAGSAYAFTLGLQALNSPKGTLDGIPAPPLFMFGVVGLAGALLDARLLRAGSIRGAHRLARHLWRMGFAMFVATASFFLGQAKMFPDALRIPAMLALPVLLVIFTTGYWLVRVFMKRRSALPATAY